MHKKAFKATTDTKKVQYEAFVNELVEELECNECREDAKKYLKENPIRKYFNLKDTSSGSDIGCFRHSWMFHNHVNRKIGKKEVDWYTAVSMFSELTGCSSCGAKEEHAKPSKYNKETGLKIKLASKYR